MHFLAECVPLLSPESPATNGTSTACLPACLPAIPPSQPRSIEYAWRNVGEMTSPSHSIPSARLSLSPQHQASPPPPINSSTIPYSPLCYAYSTLRWLYQTLLKSLIWNISATLLETPEVVYSHKARFRGFSQLLHENSPWSGSIISVHLEVYLLQSDNWHILFELIHITML
jgi:hypothetical protein